MGKLIKFKESVFIALDNKVCSFDGVKNIAHLRESNKEDANAFCKILNTKDAIK